ncbi:hypothetical protein OAG34_00260 [bacterium]|jgi:hypothetical protein|nr:hypothetical protein [bacterium]
MKTPSQLSSVTRLALTTLQYALLVVAALSLIYFFSFFGVLLSVFLVLFYTHVYAARRRNYIKNFNSALRTTIQINGRIQQTAEAFSHSGPIRRQCEMFARRLTAGEGPFDAAVTSYVPLEIETAMALTLREGSLQLDSNRHTPSETPRQKLNSLSIASQIFYLIIICFTLILFSSFYTLFIAPTLVELQTEAPLSRTNPTAYGAPTILQMTAFFIGSTAICFYLIAIVGLIPRILTLSWMPLLPVAAARKSAILTGIATTIDNRMSLDAFCQIGAKIHHGSRRRQFLKALREIENGYTDANVIYRAGWINAADHAWLEDANPTRQAELLRNISRQNIRHADANLNWIMAIAYPTAILCLASAAAPFAASFFSQLTNLITHIS